MRVRDLGALAISSQGVERPVKGSKAAAILALLVINVNRRVTVEALMNAAWGDRISAGAASTLESHIWRLRQLIEPSRHTRQSPTVLISDAGGYRLIGSIHTVDSLAFEHLAGDVRDLLSGGRAASALALADEALTLWRGRPFDSFGDQLFARPAVSRLDELHAQLREHRIDALLKIGETETALADLGALLTNDPYRERFWEQRMLALYRSGRVDESLRAFQQVRTLMIDEIGNEPGVALRELHSRILRADPELLPRQTADIPPQQPVDVHLPVFLTAMVGRDDDRDRLGPLLLAHRLVSIAGTAGCGKTRLAVGVARSVVEHFPDGVWFVDLTAISDPEFVVDVVGSTIGFVPSPAVSALEQLCQYLRDRRMLVVLDNCEHVLAAVARIVKSTLGEASSGTGRGCTFLLTTREPVNVDGEIVWAIGPLSLLPTPDTYSPAMELFLERLHSAVPQLEIGKDVLASAATICVAVDGLPLALELAAARARTYTLDDVAAQVAADPSTLRRFGRGPDDHRATLRSAVDWSFQMLTPAEQLAHRRLAVLPGEFTADMAAAVVDDPDVGDLLAQLVHRSLLSSSGSSRGPTVFRQLATVNAHARHALTDSGELAEIVTRRNQWTVDVLSARPRLGTAGEADWLLRIDSGFNTIRATLAHQLIDEPNPRFVRLPSRLGFYWYYRAGMVEASRWFRSAHEMASDPVDRLLNGLPLAATLTLQGRPDLGVQYVDDALSLIESTPAEDRIEVGEALVGAATAAWARDEFDVLRRVHGHLAEIAGLAGDEHLGVVTDAVGAVATAATGDLVQAAADGAAVHERAVAMNNTMAAWIAAGPPMVEALLSNRPSDGIEWVNRVMKGHAHVGSRAGGMFIETRANFAAQSGDYLRAARLYAAARIQTRRAAMVWPRRAMTLELLDETRNRLTAADFESAWQAGEQLTLSDIVDVRSPRPGTSS